MLINLDNAVQVVPSSGFVLIDTIDLDDFKPNHDLQLITLNLQNLQYENEAELQQLWNPFKKAYNYFKTKGVHHEDFYLTFEEIVEKAGYHYDEYKVVTEDGYHLKMFRIRNDNIINSDEQAPVVFLQHGLFSSADCWIGHKADLAPAFQFARAGYDVWLGNNRGNINSREHDTLDPVKDEEEFFTYDFQDLGEYDLPAQIDFVRKATGQDKVTYAGHSQGTSQMFYALAKNEDSLKDKINLFVAMAPVMRLGHTPSKQLKQLANYKSQIQKTFKSMGIYEVMGKKWLDMSHTVCKVLPVTCDIASDFVSPAGSFNNVKRSDVMEAKFPQPASWKQLMHYAQIIDSGKFREFDYGQKKNLEVYGQKKPPTIFVNNIKKVPVAMFVGKNDTLANPVDCQWGRDQIKSTIHYQEIDNFDHGSFVLGKNMSYMNDVLDLVAQYADIDPTPFELEFDDSEIGQTDSDNQVTISNLYGLY